MQVELEARPALAKRRVLIVDDSPTVRLTLRALLEAAGWTVTAAPDGEAAFACLAAEPFEAVVTDLTMGALGGVQLCRLIRSTPETAHTAVVLLTASHDRRTRFWAKHAGADACLEKSAVRVALASALERVARPAPDVRPAARTPPALERLSAVLDDLLFRAVLTSELHRLVERACDPPQLAKELARAIGDVIDPTFVAVTVGHGAGAVASVLARGTCSRSSSDRLFERLGIDVRPDDVSLVLDGPQLEGPFDVHEVLAHSIAIGDEVIGEVRVASSRQRISARDRDTLLLVARESALVVKNALLTHQTRELARTDALTGLANRRALEDRMRLEIDRARRARAPVGIAICDVDHFKSVNDRHGHAVGDEVLQAVGRALRDAVRNIDLVGRWGGEEFVILLPGADEMGTVRAAERMRAAIEALPPFIGGPASVTASFGAARWTGSPSASELVESADRGLYEAKRLGRNRVVVDPAPLRAAR